MSFMSMIKYLTISFYYLISILFWIPTLVAQQVVTGRITDATDGKPLLYASIFIANTTVGTYSDESGNYKITIQGEGVYEIVVTYLGYEPFLHKIETPKALHQIDIAMKRIDVKMKELIVTPSKNYLKFEKDFFWFKLLGVKPSKSGLEVLNPEKVNFYMYSEEKVFIAECDEPIEIINHEMGYHVRYVLQSFKFDFKTYSTFIQGQPFFKELISKNIRQRNNWEKKRQEVYAVSIVHFMRALYLDQLHEEGFLLKRLNNFSFPTSSDILQKNQDMVQVNIDSKMYLACCSKPVTIKMKNSEYILNNNNSFPLLLLSPQQFSIFPDGTYTGTLIIQEYSKKTISGVSAMLPLEFK